jgi:hypothetical protein
MTKVFRVLISETQGFYHDIEASTSDEAKEKVRASFKGDASSEDIQPIEDSSAYTGYQVDDAIEIPRNESDLA